MDRHKTEAARITSPPEETCMQGMFKRKQYMELLLYKLAHCLVAIDLNHCIIETSRDCGDVK